MADRDDQDWRRDSTPRMPPGSYADDVESEEDYDDDYDEDEDDDNDADVAKTGLACPFCLENFDVLGLCCHIDVEHHREAKAAICPVCVTKKIRKGGSRSALSILKKESQDEQFDSHLKKSSSVDSSSNTEPDALLLSFVYNSQPLQKPEITRPSSEASLLRGNSFTDTVKSGWDIKTYAFPNKDQERVQRCEFVHGLVFSTIFNDDI